MVLEALIMAQAVSKLAALVVEVILLVEEEVEGWMLVVVAYLRREVLVGLVVQVEDQPEEQEEHLLEVLVPLHLEEVEGHQEVLESTLQVVQEEQVLAWLEAEVALQHSFVVVGGLLLEVQEC